MKESDNIHPNPLVESEEIGQGTRIWAFVHILKGAVIGESCNIGDHCFIEDGVIIGVDGRMGQWIYEGFGSVSFRRIYRA